MRTFSSVSHSFTSKRLVWREAPDPSQKKFEVKGVKSPDAIEKQRTGLFSRITSAVRNSVGAVYGKTINAMKDNNDASKSRSTIVSMNKVRKGKQAMHNKNLRESFKGKKPSQTTGAQTYKPNQEILVEDDLSDEILIEGLYPEKGEAQPDEVLIEGLYPETEVAPAKAASQRSRARLPKGAQSGRQTAGR